MLLEVFGNIILSSLSFAVLFSALTIISEKKKYLRALFVLYLVTCVSYNLLYTI